MSQLESENRDLRIRYSALKSEMKKLRKKVVRFNAFIIDLTNN